VLCIEEFDVILHNVTPSDKITGLVQHIVERTDLPLKFLLTMIYVPESVKTQLSSPFVSISKLMTLSHLSPEELRNLVEHATRGDFDWPETCLDWLYQQYGGHPNFTKWFLSYLFKTSMSDKKQNDQPLTVNLALLEKVQTMSFQDPSINTTLENLFNVQFSDTEKEILLTLADMDTPLTISQLRNAGVHWLTIAKHLEKREYLLGEDQAYKFRMLFLKAWIKQWDKWEELLLQYNTLRGMLIDPTEIKVKIMSREVFVKGKLIELTRIQFDILRTLAEKSNQLIDRQTLVEKVWDTKQGVSEETIDTNISRLRKNLGDEGQYIETIHGQGFILHRAAIVK
jgi:hypothetical protein